MCNRECLFMCPLLAHHVAHMFPRSNYSWNAMRQFELNLTPRIEHHGSIEPWVYRFEAGTLIEELDTRRHVYGLWDKLFGCWKIDTATHVSREIVPTWVPLNARGIWRNPLDIRFENAPKSSWLLSPKWRYEANAAFAAYFSSIPPRIRGVVAPLEHHQWVALDMIWQVPEFAYFLDEEMFNGTQQYVFACIALSDAASLSRGMRRDLAKNVMSAKRASLLSHLSATRSSAKTLRLLNKLGDQPHHPATYLGLMGFLATDPNAKELLHTNNFQADAIKLLNCFPSGFLTSNLTRFVLREPEECEALTSYDDYEPGAGFRTLLSLYPALSADLQNRVRSSLKRVRSSSALAEWGENWARKVSEVVKFPAPPIKAIHRLIPLATAKAVRQEALAMRNCISRMMGRVLTGEIFFYNWEGPEPATVMLEQSPDTGWKFAKAYGYGNKKLPSQTLNYINHVVSRATK